MKYVVYIFLAVLITGIFAFAFKKSKPVSGGNWFTEEPVLAGFYSDGTVWKEVGANGTVLAGGDICS